VNFSVFYLPLHVFRFVYFNFELVLFFAFALIFQQYSR